MIRRGPIDLLLTDLSLEVLRAVVRVRAAAEERGGWPSAAWIGEVAQQEAADPWTVVLLTRQELPALHPVTGEPLGHLVPVTVPNKSRPCALLPTPECIAAASLLGDRLHCHLYDPWTREVPLRDITMMYVDWASALQRGSLLAPMRLRPGSIEGLTQEAH